MLHDIPGGRCTGVVALCAKILSRLRQPYKALDVIEQYRFTARLRCFVQLGATAASQVLSRHEVETRVRRVGQLRSLPPAIGGESAFYVAQAYATICQYTRGRAHASMEGHGVAVERELNGWRRSKFASTHGGKAHLRLIFRAVETHGIEILAFGDRDFPDTIYDTARGRA